ncbi:isocitrate/isopropylmalate family dehydrogenase [Legionella spiritensis]|uniref:DlpA protein (Isocitrate and isopropylmalate dehydrogenase family protein) n=1 Tax=Legionella spiritensis TaxID=452 RepID=A0A0W0YZ39_LEGSP|nr:isocitrate/isopropylmalate family dehydrogenase [Legionella spiritensis]KTD61918.1 DlpA protein (isocitrate and isopropylmalate dehydrogenase family protein) [Legionella spiritensis]SNV31101.1 DlpA protein [Legionella spiritensis]
MAKRNDRLNIAVLPGDGIGREVTEAALPVFHALRLPVAIRQGDIGWSCWQKTGQPIPASTWQLIRDSDATLIGAITSKPQREALQELPAKLQQQGLSYISPLIQLRQQLDLFANVRPCFNITDESNPFHFCVIRENTEGLYSGFDFHPIPAPIRTLLQEHRFWQEIPNDEVSCTLRLQSRRGLLRLFEFAFQYAHQRKMSLVTFADKPNVLRQSSAFARELFESVAQHYPHIKAEIRNVDAVAFWLVKRPQEFGVIVAENMFGDLLSDVGAAVMGGLGFAPSANIGHHSCYFEPVHGSGPRIKPHSANPGAMFLTIGLLLEHFGYDKAAQAIRQAVTHVARETDVTTYDIGGHGSTNDMAQAIIEQAASLVAPSKTAGNPQALLQKRINGLQQYNSAEISDALDACGVEGALLHIKPLSPGKKLIGPAYTVQYQPYKKPVASFKQAANYIDHVPEKAVLVIDNQGRVDCTVWGDILTRVALMRRLAGTVINGAARDIKQISKSGYPLFYLDPYMRTGKNRVQKSGEQCPVTIQGVTIHPGDFIFGDDNGVLVIPVSLVDDVLDKAQNIQVTEQKIIEAVASGSTLKQARKDFHYDQPWLSHEKPLPGKD